MARLVVTFWGARDTSAKPGMGYLLVLWGGLGFGGHAAAACSNKQQRQQRGVRASRGLQSAAGPVARDVCGMLVEWCRQQ
eukprot:scaffold113077_cov18-Tisochrysis_lutea.AAC.1